MVSFVFLSVKDFLSAFFLCLLSFGELMSDEFPQRLLLLT